MTTTAPGTVVCDRCGRDVGNGGIDKCIIVSDLDPDDAGLTINYHFCRDQVDDNGKVTEKGCARKVLAPSNVQHFEEEIRSERRAAAERAADERPERADGEVRQRRGGRRAQAKDR